MPEDTTPQKPNDQPVDTKDIADTSFASETPPSATSATPPAVGNEIATAPVIDVPVAETTSPIDVTEAPKDDVMPGLESEGPANETPAAAPKPPVSPAEETETAATVPSAADAIKKKKGMGLVILIVVIIVAALAVAGYFAFLKEDEKSATTPETTTQTSTEETAVNPDDVSATIDESIADLDDTADFDSGELSDTTLGL